MYLKSSLGETAHVSEVTMHNSVVLGVELVMVIVLLITLNEFLVSVTSAVGGSGSTAAVASQLHLFALVDI